MNYADCKRAIRRNHVIGFAGLAGQRITIASLIDMKKLVLRAGGKRFRKLLKRGKYIRKEGFLGALNP